MALNLSNIVADIRRRQIIFPPVFRQLHASVIIWCIHFPQACDMPVAMKDCAVGNGAARAVLASLRTLDDVQT
jgi:hypothetical protein